MSTLRPSWVASKTGSLNLPEPSRPVTDLYRYCFSHHIFHSHGTRPSDSKWISHLFHKYCIPFSLHFALSNHHKNFSFFPCITQYNKFKLFSYISQLVAFAGFAPPPPSPEKDFPAYTYRKLGETKPVWTLWRRGKSLHMSETKLKPSRPYRVTSLTGRLHAYSGQTPVLLVLRNAVYRLFFTKRRGWITSLSVSIIGRFQGFQTDLVAHTRKPLYTLFLNHSAKSPNSRIMPTGD